MKKTAASQPPRAKPLREAAVEVVTRLHQAGFSAFWVGGCVRDFLLGREPGDYDIATSAKPGEVEKTFPRTIPVGRQFGVIIVVHAGHTFQVATFRAEGDYQDGRHPGKVTFSDARNDAVRRDFTVNGLFYDPEEGKIHDWVGGETDLRAKIIRTIGTPAERFAEDHLRLLRAVRFATQLNFDIEPGTFATLRERASSIKTISAERIREELVKLFHPPHAARGLKLLHESGLLEFVIPELAATLTCEQSPDYHPEGNVFNHLVKMLGFLPLDAHPSLPWAVLLHDIAKPMTAERDAKTGSIHFYGHERIGAEMADGILRRLRFPRRQTEGIVHAVRCHMQFKDAPQMRKATLRRMLLRPTFPLEIELHRLDCLGSHGSLEVYDFLLVERAALDHQPQIKPPLLNGRDLLGLGMQPGPAMGALLAEARDLQLSEELKTKTQAVRWAKQQLKSRD